MHRFNMGETSSKSSSTPGAAGTVKRWPRRVGEGKQMNGRQIDRIYFGGNEGQAHIAASRIISLEWSVCDVIGAWVIQKENGVETARHNARFIETIIWK